MQVLLIMPQVQGLKAALTLSSTEFTENNKGKYIMGE